MFERFERSWSLVQASFNVLRSDKELIVFPIVSSVVTLVISILFLIPSWSAGVFDAALEGRNTGGGGIGSYIVLFLFYVVSYSVIFYCNTALVSAAVGSTFETST